MKTINTCGDDSLDEENDKIFFEENEET